MNTITAMIDSEINWGEKPEPHMFVRVGEGHYRLVQLSSRTYQRFRWDSREIVGGPD